MEANEIRAESINGNGDLAVQHFQARMLQEIAAQLAELNAHLDWVTDAGYVRVDNRN